MDRRLSPSSCPAKGCSGTGVRCLQELAVNRLGEQVIGLHVGIIEEEEEEDACRRDRWGNKARQPPRTCIETCTQ